MITYKWRWQNCVGARLGVSLLIQLLSAISHITCFHTIENKNKWWIIHQNPNVDDGGTSAGYPKQVFRNYVEIEYFIKISRRSISYL